MQLILRETSCLIGILVFVYTDRIRPVEANLDKTQNEKKHTEDDTLRSVI